MHTKYDKKSENKFMLFVFITSTIFFENKAQLTYQKNK